MNNCEYRTAAWRMHAVNNKMAKIIEMDLIKNESSLITGKRIDLRNYFPTNQCSSLGCSFGTCLLSEIQGHPHRIALFKMITIRYRKGQHHRQSKKEKKSQ